MTNKTNKNKLEISWLGIDGALVAGYFVVVAVIVYGIFNKSDLLIGTIIPYGIMIAVTLIFINYLSIIMKFVKPKDKK